MRQLREYTLESLVQGGCRYPEIATRDGLCEACPRKSGCPAVCACSICGSYAPEIFMGHDDSFPLCRNCLYMEYRWKKKAWAQLSGKLWAVKGCK